MIFKTDKFTKYFQAVDLNCNTKVFETLLKHIQDHHWAQFRLNDGIFHDYDDNNNVGGYTIPIEGFTEDNKMATIVMKRLT